MDYSRLLGAGKVRRGCDTGQETDTRAEGATLCRGSAAAREELHVPADSSKKEICTVLHLPACAQRTEACAGFQEPG